MEPNSGNGILEDFRIEFLHVWRRLPNKGFFFVMLLAWFILFQFLGNSTLGYGRTNSLLEWMYLVYSQCGISLMQSDNGYCAAVPLLVLLLFWFKRRELVALPLQPWWPAMLLVVSGLGLHVVGYLIQQPSLSIVALFTGLYGLTGLAWGRAWLRGSFFPFVLFLFCVPPGPLIQPISFRLQILVCQVVTGVCHYVLAIDVIRQGTQLLDATGHYNYEVAPACSGIHSLIATLGLAIVVGLLSFRTWWKRVLMVGLAFPFAVLGNLVRMLSIIIAAEIGGQKAGNYVHEGGPGGIFSLIPYVLAFAGMLVVEHFLYERPLAPATAPKPQEALTA